MSPGFQTVIIPELLAGVNEEAKTKSEKLLLCHLQRPARQLYRQFAPKADLSNFQVFSFISLPSARLK
jgi:hypothetical protein